MTFTGHGKFYHFTEHNQTAYEGELNRVYAKMFEEAMQGTGIEIVKVFHPFMDRYNQERIAIANQDYAKTKPTKSLWLSFHSNAYGMASSGASQEPRGYSIFTSDGESPADDCATLIWQKTKEATEVLGMTFRADYSEGYDRKKAAQPDYDINFEELAYTMMPAVLIENGFFTNWKDVLLLQDKTYQQAMIKATKEGVLQWFNKT
jgi:N-acetylmuramoyl-L-alanine amidase